MREFDIEKVLDVGNVELFAVVGDEDREALDVAKEIVEVMTEDVIVDGGAVIKGDGGEVIAMAGDAGGFDIEEGGTGAEFWEEAPEGASGEELCEEVGIEGIERGKGVVQEGERMRVVSMKQGVVFGLQRIVP